MKTVLALAFAAVCAVSFAQCADKPACCKAPKDKIASTDAAFLAEAQRMTLAAEGKKACCKSTAEKPLAKGDAGCCNAKGETAKFKVYVAGQGYRFFGCAGSAGKGRSEILAEGKRAGAVQPVTGRVVL